MNVAELVKDYEQSGSFLRRKDATVSNPSDLYTISDVLELANKEIAQAQTQRDLLLAFMNKLMASGSWFYSAIEFDADADGTELYNEAVQLLKAVNEQ